MSARVALHATDGSERLALVRAFESAPTSWDVFLWSGTEDYDVLVGDAASAPGAVPFDPTQPQRTVAAVGDALSVQKRRVTVVTGARRGCGVSTLALHLSAALSSIRNTCLLDLDPDSSLRARLGLPADARGWGQVEGGVRAAALPLAGGFRILLAPVDRKGDAADVLRSAAASFDHLVIDAPSSPWRALALGATPNAVIVIPPSPQGIAHACAVFDRHPQTQWSCVINRVGAGGEMTQAHVAQELGRPITMELPCSPFLRDREDKHRLLDAGWSRYFRRTRRLASALA